MKYRINCEIDTDAPGVLARMGVYEDDDSPIINLECHSNIAYICVSKLGPSDFGVNFEVEVFKRFWDMASHSSRTYVTFEIFEDAMSHAWKVANELGVKFCDRGE